MGVWQVFFQEGDNSGFFQVVAKITFPGRANSNEILFYQLETKKNIFQLKRSYKNIKFRNPGEAKPPAHPSDAHASRSNLNQALFLCETISYTVNYGFAVCWRLEQVPSLCGFVTKSNRMSVDRRAEKVQQVLACLLYVWLGTFTEARI